MKHLDDNALKDPDRQHFQGARTMAATAIRRWVAEMPLGDRAKTYTPRQIEAALAMPMTQLAAALHEAGFTHFTRRTPRGTPLTYWAGPDAGDPKRPLGRPPHEDSTHEAFEATLFYGTPARLRPVWHGVDYDHRVLPSKVAGMAWDFYAHSFPGWANNPGGRLYCLYDPELAAALMGHHGGNDRRTRCRKMAITYGLMMGKRYRPGMESLNRLLPEPRQAIFRAEWKQCEASMLRQLDHAHQLNANSERPDKLEVFRQDYLDQIRWTAAQLDVSNIPGAALYAQKMRDIANHPNARPRH